MSEGTVEYCPFAFAGEGMTQLESEREKGKTWF